MPKLTRRSFVGSSGAAVMIAGRGFARDSRANTGERLHYRQPARSWNEALPVGNGRIGAMIFGRVAQERLQLNEETLWAGSPYTPDNPGALSAIPEVRRLLAAGDYKAAAALASDKVMARPLQQMAYGSCGDVLIDIEGAQEPAEYERTLDLATAVASVRYRIAESEYAQETFASAPDDVIVWRSRARGKKLNLEIGYRAPRKAKYASPDYQGSATELSGNEKIDWLVHEADRSADSEVTRVADGTGAMLITGRNSSGPGVAAGLTFALRLQIATDGKIEVREGRMIVSDAREVLLLVAAATNYVNYHDVGADPVARVRLTTDAASRKRYEDLKRAHIREYQSLYKSVSLELPTSPAGDRPTDERIVHGETGDDPALAALYFQFARYLLISSSRPGCQPANLQGIWNEGTNPPWGSKYTININTEMNYWPADAGGLGRVRRAAAAAGGGPGGDRRADRDGHVRRARLGRAPQHRSVARDRADRRPAVGPVALRRRLAVQHVVGSLRLQRATRAYLATALSTDARRVAVLPRHAGRRSRRTRARHFAVALARERPSARRVAVRRAGDGPADPARSVRAHHRGRRSSSGPTRRCARNCATRARRLAPDAHRQGRAVPGVARRLGRRRRPNRITAMSRISMRSIPSCADQRARHAGVGRRRARRVARHARRPRHGLGHGLAPAICGRAWAMANTRTRSSSACSGRSAPIPTCSTPIRRSRSTAISAARPASSRCSCSRGEARCGCCPRCQRPGPQARCAAFAHAAGCA